MGGAQFLRLEPTVFPSPLTENKLPFYFLQTLSVFFIHDCEQKKAKILAGSTG